jgi:hypothetical protein
MTLGGLSGILGCSLNFLGLDLCEEKVVEDCYN